MKTRFAFVPALALTVILTACTAAGGGTPTPSPSPSNPPSASPAPIVGSPEEAAARVIASDPRFVGITRKDDNLIGQGSWWQAETKGDTFQVQVQIGWGDCPAGCIDRHDWTFDVAADGTITLVEETGPPLPAG